MLENLHPMFAEILRPHLAVTAQVKALELYYPGVGNTRRGYRSLGAQFQYEAGFLAFRDGDTPPTLKTPFRDGWHDAAAVWDGKAEHDLGLDGDDGVPA